MHLGEKSKSENKMNSLLWIKMAMKMWTRKLTQQLLLMTLLLTFLLGCSPAGTYLAGTEWELVSLDGNDLIEGTVITLVFSEEYLGGEMGCNGYGGSPEGGKYHAMGDGTFTLLSPFAVTVQLCSEPEGIMEQEEGYVEALMKAASFRVFDNRLEFVDETGKTILIYKAK
jgi:heat shock protein HslJ